ncbi:MAG: HAD family hydrolase [Candidatus Woesearchaeota archaeon]
MKPIIAFDFDGTTIKSAISEEAHKDWYRIMSILLKDPKVVRLAGKKDFMGSVITITKRYTGIQDKVVLVKLARNLYQLILLGKAQEHDILVKDMTQLLKTLRKKYRTALVTTSPEDVVKPLLKASGALFDIVFLQPLHEKPSKLVLLRRFTARYGKPTCYIGNSREDVTACKTLRIKSVLAKWDRFDNVKADFEASTVRALKGLLFS